MATKPGMPYPLGATFTGSGTNFALFSRDAVRVDLCLFDSDGTEGHIQLQEADAFVWHVFVEDVQPGQLYGYRVHGPYLPTQGLRFNPSKLLLDPYAKAMTGSIEWNVRAFLTTGR